MSGLFPIFWHYSEFTILIAVCIAVAIFSIALEAEMAKIPLIGPWLASNIGHIREWAIVIAILAFSHVMIYGIGVSNGEARVKAQWAAAEKAAVERAKDARASAVNSVKRNPSGVHNDPYERND
jgi:hypothetical protein